MMIILQLSAARGEVKSPLRKTTTIKNWQFFAFCFVFCFCFVNFLPLKTQFVPSMHSPPHPLQKTKTQSDPAAARHVLGRLVHLSASSFVDFDG